MSEALKSRAAAPMYGVSSPGTAQSFIYPFV